MNAPARMSIPVAAARLHMSLRAAINAHCKWCIYDEKAPGNWRQQVHACAITRCHLWPVRPKSSGKTTPENRPASDSTGAL